MEENPYFRRRLNAEFSLRASRNRRYSIRSFARDLGLDPGTTSRVLSGKQVPGSRIGKRICERLSLTADEEAQFFSSLALAKKASKVRRMSPALRKLLSRGRLMAPKELSLETYSVISEWYHAVILEMPFLQGFKSDPRWIARELGISESEARKAISRLTALKLLGKRNGKLANAGGQLTTANKALTTAAHQRNQRQFLEQAIFALQSDPIEKRNMIRVTMAIDPDRLPSAKEMISRFNRRLCRFLESGRRREVYTFSSAFFSNHRGTRGQS